MTTINVITIINHYHQSLSPSLCIIVANKSLTISYGNINKTTLFYVVLHRVIILNLLTHSLMKTGLIMQPDWIGIQECCFYGT
jgi:hypothetical protein